MLLHQPLFGYIKTLLVVTGISGNCPMQQSHGQQPATAVLSKRQTASRLYLALFTPADKAVDRVPNTLVYFADLATEPVRIREI
jgi:hypothetical protein